MSDHASDRRYVVTGAAGFLGSHLCEALLRQGHRVIGIDDLSSGRSSNLASFARHPSFSFHEADVLDGIPVHGPVEGVFHLISPTPTALCTGGGTDRLPPLPTGIEGALYKLRLMLGTDRQGRSILIRAVYSAKVAIQVGLVVSLIAVSFGSLLGAAAGYFGGIADHLIIWLYSTFSSIPYLVLLVVLAFMFTGSKVEGTLIPLYVAFCLTYWIGPCRVTRGEALKLKALDYVQAANALGASRSRILMRHIVPNTAHLMFINLSLLFIGAIKGEVVLTFLGLGLKEGASWGIMINQSKSEVVSGFFWQIGSATFFMFVLVLAFNVLTDALQDAFDPKHVG